MGPGAAQVPACTIARSLRPCPLDPLPCSSLLDYVRDRKKLPESEAVTIFQQLLHALQFCHRKDVRRPPAAQEGGACVQEAACGTALHPRCHPMCWGVVTSGGADRICCAGSSPLALPLAIADFWVCPGSWLALASGLQVVHRDIKLENILIDSAGHMKLIDFGLCGYFVAGKRLRCHCGSPSYAAPEIVVGVGGHGGCSGCKGRPRAGGGTRGGRLLCLRPPLCGSSLQTSCDCLFTIARCARCFP